MLEENIIQEFRLKNIEAIKNYFIKEIDQNELINENHKKALQFQIIVNIFFSFCDYWMSYNVCICFFAWCSYRNYEFCNSIKNLPSNCSN